MSKSTQRYDDASLLEELRKIINSSDVISAEATIKRIAKLMSGRGGKKGGATTKKRYGTKYYSEISKKRWDKQRSQGKQDNG